MNKQWSEVELYDEAQLTSIVDNSMLYNPKLVEACKHELEKRLKYTPLMQTVLAFDDRQLREILTNPSMYSEELVSCCRAERKKRSKSKSMWIWWAISGALVAAVSVLLCVAPFSGQTKGSDPIQTPLPVDSIPGVYPQASQRLLTPADLRGFSKNQLRIMRNEILARQGYIFKKTDLREYFESQNWYEGIHSNVNDVNKKLSPIEWENMELIREFEKK